MREVVAAGLIGEVIGAHVAIRWNHGWIAGTAFEAIDDLLLWDFGIHWFDFLSSVIGERPLTVCAAAARAASQAVRPPMLAEARIAFSGGQASLILNGAARYGACDTTAIIGTEGTVSSSRSGPSSSARDAPRSHTGARPSSRQTRR